MTYDVTVDGMTTNGTELTNGAEIGNTIPEEPIWDNTDSQPVVVPHPDVTVSIDVPPTVLPGETFPYIIDYRNLNRTCAEDTYFVHTLADDLVMPAETAGQDTDPDVEFASITLAQGTAYFHDGPIGTPPSFDPINPLANGWTDDHTTLTNSVSHIAVVHGTLCDADGTYTVTINSTVPNSSTIAGLDMEFDVEIDATNEPDG